MKEVVHHQSSTVPELSVFWNSRGRYFVDKALFNVLFVAPFDLAVSCSSDQSSASWVWCVWSSFNVVVLVKLLRCLEVGDLGSGEF